MSLTTLAGLKASIAGWLKRTNLTDSIPDFITLAEARIGRDFRLPQQLALTTVNVAISGTTAALPTDFLQAKSLSFQQFNSPFDAASLERVYAARRQYATSGAAGMRPTLYSIQGTTLHLGPASDAAYVLDLAYYARFPALAADTDTNWLLTNAPGVYLWAALAEAAPWLMDDARIALWESKYGVEKQAVIDAQRMAEYSGASLQLSSINTQAVV